MCRPDTSHIIHEVVIRYGNGKMQLMRAPIDCGATTIFMAPRLQTRLGLADESAYLMTLGRNGQVMSHASDSRNMELTVHYMEHISPGQELELLVVPMRAYDLDL